MSGQCLRDHVKRSQEELLKRVLLCVSLGCANPGERINKRVASTKKGRFCPYVQLDGDDIWFSLVYLGRGVNAKCASNLYT